MNAMPALYALGTCLVAALLAAGPASPSWFEAYTTGTKSLALGGSAEFGSVADDDGQGPFVLTLGADSPTGAVLFTRFDGPRLEPGVYPLGSDAPDAVEALVVTGSPGHPTGAFRARAGRLIVTASSCDFMAGRFEIDAVGFEAADPSVEDKELGVRGTFRGLPSHTASPAPCTASR